MSVRAWLPLALWLAANGLPDCLPLTTDPTHPGVRSLEPIDVKALSERIAKLHRLPIQEPIEIQALSDDDFHRRLLARDRGGRSARRARGAFWQTFGLSVSDRSPDATEDRVLEEQVTGFYDHHAKVLFVRGSMGSDGQVAPRYLGTRLVLAHEIVHALQDQHFDLTHYDQDCTDDERLAHEALLEGDAVVTSNALAAIEGDGTSLRERIANWLRDLSLRTVAERAAVPSVELRQAPLLLQRRVLFPYLEGAAFALRVYEFGGFDTMNRALARPPRSTEQVLHFDKYLAGEQPVPMAWPRPLMGSQVVSEGRMGELQTGVLLSKCLSQKDAERAASGWGGDVWAIFADSSGQTTLLWSTVWDDETAAARFEHAAADRASCPAAEPLFADVGRQVAVLRDGLRVAYVQGPPEATQESNLRDALSMPYDPIAPDPPFASRSRSAGR
jgi:hypothetical protein